jgi:hypothetical protein
MTKRSRVKTHLTTPTGGLGQSMTSDKGFANNIINLHDLIEGIKSADGIQIRVQSITIDLRLYGNDGDPAWVFQPLIVQTVGTWTDTVNLAQRVIDEILDQAIDDVFGYQPIGEPRTTRRVFPLGGNTTQQGSEIRIQVPMNIISLLNKETETERLQNLLFGIVGVMNGTTDVYTLYYTITVRYTEERKSITIR